MSRTVIVTGLIVDAGREWPLHASYSESFLSVGNLDFFRQSFKPRQRRRYEVGLKQQ